MKILIECTERIKYRKVVEMTQAEWEELKQLPGYILGDSQTSPLSHLLDRPDIYDRGDFTDVEMTVVDKREDD